MFDGRIDNREEIAGVGCTASDAEVVLRAYARWGKGCPGRLLGDFAFAIWDKPNRRLFCARDIVGVKPLYYTTSRNRFACSSTVGALLELPGVEATPNEGVVGEFLANTITSQEDTLLADIVRLPAAHALSVERGNVRKWRYWDIDTVRSVRYRTDAEYQEHFLGLFEEAVRCRLRGSVGVELSGGLDSSSVVAVSKGLLGDRPLETFSIVFPDMPCDESQYSNAVARKFGVKGNHAGPYLPPPSLYVEAARRHGAFPGYPNTHMSRPIMQLARQKGYSALLTGLGGDEWFGGSLYRYADLVRRGQLATLAREVKADYGRLGSRPALGGIFRFGLLPLVATPVRGWLPALRHRHQTPPFVDPGFAARGDLADRVRSAAKAHRFASYAQQHLYRTLRNGAWTHGNEVEERVTTALGIELRHPFLDRRLIEFAMAIPEEQRWHDGIQKRVLRGALSGRLPELVLTRQDKAEFSVVFGESFVRHGGPTLFDKLAIAERGWLDHARARDAYRQVIAWTQQGMAHIPGVCHLWQVYGLELWHQALFSSDRSATDGQGTAKETTDGNDGNEKAA